MSAHEAASPSTTPVQDEFGMVIGHAVHLSVGQIEQMEPVVLKQIVMDVVLLLPDDQASAGPVDVIILAERPVR